MTERAKWWIPTIEHQVCSHAPSGPRQSSGMEIFCRGPAAPESGRPRGFWVETVTLRAGRHRDDGGYGRVRITRLCRPIRPVLSIARTVTTLRAPLLGSPELVSITPSAGPTSSPSR